MDNEVVSTKLLANEEKVETSETAEGLVLNVSCSAPDTIVSVIKVEVKGNVADLIPKVPQKEMKSGALD